MLETLREWAFGPQDPLEKRNEAFLSDLSNQVYDYCDEKGMFKDFSVTFLTDEQWKEQGLSDSTRGLFNGNFETDNQTIRVHLPAGFDASDPEQAFEVAKTAFHEATHQKQFEAAKTGEYDSEIRQEAALNLAAHHSAAEDDIRYEYGYDTELCEIDANLSALDPTIDIMHRHFPDLPEDELDKIATQSYITQYYPDAMEADDDTTDEIREALTDFANKSMESSTPEPCAPDSDIYKYLKTYASDEFVDAWKNAKSNHDRTKLAMVGTMMYDVYALDKPIPASINTSKFDWTLSDGTDTRELLGIDQKQGGLMAVAADWAKANMEKKDRDPYEWSSKHDVARSLAEWLGSQEEQSVSMVVQNKDGSGTTTVYSDAFVNEKGVSYSGYFGHLDAEDADTALDLLASGQAEIVGADPADMPDIVKDYLSETKTDKINDDTAKRIIEIFPTRIAPANANANSNTRGMVRGEPTETEPGQDAPETNPSATTKDVFKNFFAERQDRAASMLDTASKAFEEAKQITKETVTARTTRNTTPQADTASPTDDLQMG